MIEVEIRAKTSSLEKAKQNLVDLGANFVKSEDQIDKVYGRSKDLDENHKIIEGRFSARIRSASRTTKVEFKEIRRTGSGLEFSSEVPKIEDGVNLLLKLDFEEAFSVAKKRETYKVENFEVCLDKVEKLGNFIEIEHAVNTGENVEEALSECKALLEKIDSKAQIEPQKYGDLMQELINSEGAK